MERYALLFLFLVFLASCANDDDFGLESTQFVFSEQKWELTQMSGSFQNSETTGEEMEWQEYYIFSPEGTFVKSRTIGDELVEATGSFEVVEYENDLNHYLELNFETGNELAGNCTGDSKELLMYRNSTMISSLWMACDGPGLDYSLSKK
ncbi:hypothetical protein [Maribacter sp. 1_MG-2023]|uniref:hypothetical protein n=1 Tax=Maribacter sp. 1_MG-2023 TaxID=3062677 RepID=UPI0026E28084|nr:hypothetical protein [Maribacter sp. 1_MG-2023]MDO6471102.1 hypothetical protein [Maribacter sp. 1_MG-2023]